MSALIMRARDLNQITDRQAKRFWTKMGELGYRTNEPYPIASEEPSIVKDVVDLHLRHYGYSVPELSKAVGLYVEEFRSLYIHEMPRLRLVE